MEPDHPRCRTRSRSVPVTLLRSVANRGLFSLALTPMLFDTHAHLFDNRFRKDLPAVLERAAAAGVERVVCLGIDRESSRESVAIANAYQLVVAAVGIQPNSAAEARPDDWNEIVRLAETEPRVVAIGETGLDRYRTTPRSRCRRTTSRDTSSWPVA